MSDSGIDSSVTTWIQKSIDDLNSYEVKSILQEGLNALKQKTTTLARDTTERKKALAQLGELGTFIRKWGTRLDGCTSSHLATSQCPSLASYGLDFDGEGALVQLKRIINDILNGITADSVDATQWTNSDSLRDLDRIVAESNDVTQSQPRVFLDDCKQFLKETSRHNKAFVGADSFVSAKLSECKAKMDTTVDALHAIYGINIDIAGEASRSSVAGLIVKTWKSAYANAITDVYYEAEALAQGKKGTKEDLQGFLDLHVVHGVRAFEELIRTNGGKWLECEQMIQKLAIFEEKRCEVENRIAYNTTTLKSSAFGKEYTIDDIKRKINKRAHTDSLNLSGLRCIVATILACFSTRRQSLREKLERYKAQWLCTEQEFKPYADALLKNKWTPLDSPATKLDAYLRAGHMLVNLIRADSRSRGENSGISLTASAPSSTPIASSRSQTTERKPESLFVSSKSFQQQSAHPPPLPPIPRRSTYVPPPFPPPLPPPPLPQPPLPRPQQQFTQENAKHTQQHNNRVPLDNMRLSRHREDQQEDEPPPVPVYPSSFMRTPPPAPKRFNDTDKERMQASGWR